MRHILSVPICMLIYSATAFSQPIHDTVTVLKTNRTKPAIYKAPDGKLYKVRFVADPSEPITLESLRCGEDKFSGKHRKGPKTSFATGSVVSFTTITKLLQSLEPDNVIRPKLTTGTNKRITEEKKNVRLPKVFLYAMKKESDNDYHVIIGDNKVKSKATLLNVEISGVPQSGNTVIQQVRDFFEDNFVELCGSKYAVFTENPIPVTLEGSVFYDVDHTAGSIGPTGLRPTTAWEIHPISKINFR